MACIDAMFMHLHAFSHIRDTTNPICQHLGKMISWTHFLTSAREHDRSDSAGTVNYVVSLGSSIWEVMSETEAETKHKQENTAHGEIWENLENWQYLNGFMSPSSFQNEPVNNILHH